MEIHSILKGENLTRYQNIQETLRQTQRTLSMSGKNGKQLFYEDILPIIGHKKDLEGSLHSLSKKNVSPTCEEKKMRDTDYKYANKYSDKMDKIKEKSDYMLDDLKFTFEGNEHQLPMVTEDSPCRTEKGTIESLDEINMDQPGPQGRKGGISNINMRLYDGLTPKEEESIYEELCNRYGKDSGRSYLLVRSMIAPENESKAWDVCENQPAEAEIYNEGTIECPATKKKSKENYVCPEISAEVTEKMETLLDIRPNCDTDRLQQSKRWKDALKFTRGRPKARLGHFSIMEESPCSSVGEDEDYDPCTCGLRHCDCDLIRETCDPPEITKQCYIPDSEGHEMNNYVVTIRDHLKAKLHNELRMSVLQQHAMKRAQRVTRESVYLHSAYEQAQNELFACLMSVMPPQSQELCDDGFLYVQQLANVIAEHKMIHEREWRVWRHNHTKMEREDSEELDSLDSDIETSGSSENESSECDIKFSESLHPSRIPYFRETYELASVLFEKIDSKMEGIINKNFDVRMLRMKKPQSYKLREKFKHLQDGNKLFSQICKELGSDDYFKRKLIPFAEQKRRKRMRANRMKSKLNERQYLRKLIEGVQLGKKYRRLRRSFLYTEQGKFKGFSPRRKMILRQPGVEKFKKLNLPGKDYCGRRLTKKVIHNDYRLIRSLFSDHLTVSKESLWDPGMRARMEEFSAMLKGKHDAGGEQDYEEEKEELSSDVSVGTKQSKRPVKEELQKTKTAPPNGRAYTTKGSTYASEAFTSMKSSRNDASPISRNRDPSKLPNSRKETATSIGKTTIRHRSFELGSEWLITSGRGTSDFRPSQADEPVWVPSSQYRTPIKQHSTNQHISGRFKSSRISNHVDNLSKGQSSRRTTSVGRTTVKSSIFEPVSEWLIKSAQTTPGFGSSRLGKSEPISSSHQPSAVKRYPSIPGSFNSPKLSGSGALLPLTSHLKRGVRPRHPLAMSSQSISTKQSSINPKVSDIRMLHHQKSARTVR